MAACSGVNCATLCVAAATFFSNDATVAEESAARPSPLPATKRKLRRVRSPSMEFEIVTRWESARLGVVGSSVLSDALRQVKNMRSRVVAQFENGPRYGCGINFRRIMMY